MKKKRTQDSHLMMNKNPAVRSLLESSAVTAWEAPAVCEGLRAEGVQRSFSR
jgi:hypothetical protein